jgi:hypothetical protein
MPLGKITNGLQLFYLNKTPELHLIGH